MSTIHLAVTLVMVGVLLLSGIAKLRDHAGTVAAIKGFGVIPVPEDARALVARVVPVVEIVLAIGLLVTSGPSFIVIGTLVVALMLGFTVLVSVTLARGEAPSCHCFGELTPEPISKSTAIRNAVLTVFAVVVAYGVLPATGVWRTVRDESGWQVTWAFTVLVASAALAALYFLWRREASQRAALTVELESRPVGVVAEPVDIPDIELVDALGARVNLVELAQDKAQLLVFISPTCINCHDLVPHVPMWSAAFMDQVDVALVTIGSVEDTLAEFNDVIGDLSLYGDENAVAQLSLNVGATPAAVLIGTNGKVSAGPALGAERISELVSAIVQAVGVNVVTGMAHAPSDKQVAQQEEVNRSSLPGDDFETLNPMVALDDGEELLFADAVARFGGGEPVPVVAWRDSCGFCESITPAMLEPNAAGDVLLLINESISTVRAQGFTGPVMQVIDSDAGSVLGVPGTPAGYPVLNGRKAPGGGVGGPDVLKMLGFVVTEDGHVHKNIELEALDHSH
ncbi:MauE/DoxX family redox-associated membrane protein [Dermatophilaceae bacterium Sec6.4]